MARTNRGNAGRKIVQVNNALGNKNIGKQQGTTRILYDSLPLVGNTTPQILRFFENVANRAFPFTNLNQNKLNVGETMAVQRFSLCILTMTIPVAPATIPLVANVLPLDNIAAGTNALYRSDLDVLIAEDTVIKKLPLQSMYAPFNKDSKFYGQILVNPGTPEFEANIGMPHDVFHFDNDIVLPQDLEFIFQLKIPPFALLPNTLVTQYLMLTVEGLGSLFSPKTTY